MKQRKNDLCLSSALCCIDKDIPFHSPSSWPRIGWEMYGRSDLRLSKDCKALVFLLAVINVASFVSRGWVCSSGRY